MFGGGAPSGTFSFGGNNNNNNNNNQQQQQQPAGGLFGGAQQQGQQNTFGASTGGGFGASPFGATQQQQPAGGGLFGAQNNAQLAQPASGGFSFGQPQQNQQQQVGTGAFGAARPAFGGFGSTPASSAPSGGFSFGAAANTQQQPQQQQQQQSSGGLFGSTPSSNAFGAKPATGGLFGQQPAASGAFGQQPASGGLFGAASTAAPAQVLQGSSNPPYQATVLTEKDAANNQASFAYQSISCMPQYKAMSFEELRVQDYEQGRKAGNASAGAGGLGASTGFGAGFGQQQNQPAGGGLFGSSQPQAGGAFGQPQQQQQSGGLFGPSQSQPGQTGGLFGQSQSQPAQSGGLFGQSQSQPAQSGGLFGSQQNTTQPASTGFGFGANNNQQQQQPASGGFGFGANNNNNTNNTAAKPGGLFGGGFGSSTTTPAPGSTFGGFGQNNNQQQQGQQQGQTVGAFGGTSGFSFGAPKPAATGGLFGSSQPTSTPGQTSFGGFGASNAGAAASKPAFSFGAPAPASSSGSAFGSTIATHGGGGGLFGSQPQPTTTSQPAAGGSLFGGGLGQQNNQQQQQGSTGFGFGANNTSNNNSTTNNTGTTGGGLFGNTAAKPGGLFGSSTTQPAGQTGGTFGSGTTGGFSFGAPSNTQQQGQQQQQKPGGFGFGSSTTGTGGGLFGGGAGTTGGGLFGASTAGGAGTGNTGGGLFGSSTANNNQGTSGGLFGQSTHGGGAAGQSTLGGSNLFGSTNQQAQQSLPPQGVGLTSDPYGTDALFRSMTGGSAANQPSLPFNVSTSSPGPGGAAGLSASAKSKVLPAPMMSPFRPNPKNASRVARLRGNTPARESSPSAGVGGLFGRSSSPALNGANGLFKGLSDEVGSPSDGGLPNQAFVGRHSVKRLVLNDAGSPGGLGRSLRAGTEDPDRSAGVGLRDSVFGAGARSGTVPPRERGIGGVAFSPAQESGFSARKRGYTPAAANASAATGDDSFADSTFGSRAALFADTPSKANPSSAKGRSLLVGAGSGSRPVLPQSEPSLEDLPNGSYHLSPSVNALRQMTYAALAEVNNFTVTRKGYGSVHFLTPVDLTGVQDLNIIPGGIVQLRDKEIWVYPQKEDLEPGLDGMRTGYERNPVPKAAEGEALNVPAEVTLERCWPIDKATRQPLKTPSHPRVKQHLAKLQKKGETRFIDYDAVTGTWHFEVDHFSRYGLDDSDEDMEPSETEAQAQQAKAAKKVLRHQVVDEEDDDDDVPPPRRALRAGTRSRSAKADDPPSLTSASSDEDDYEEDDEELASQASSDMRESELALDTFPAKSGRGWEPKESTPRAKRQHRVGRSATPRSFREGTVDSTGANTTAVQPWAAQLGVEARRVQVMQASFFGDRAPGDSEDKARTPREDFIVSKRKYVPGVGGGGKGAGAGVQTQEQAPRADPAKQTAITAAPPQQPARLVEVAPLTNKFTRVDLNESIVKGLEGIPLDAGLAFGRSFRVGFGPGGLLVHNGRIAGVSSKRDSRPERGSKDDAAGTGFSVLHLEKARVFSKGGEAEQTQAEKALKLLELQLSHSEIDAAEEDDGAADTACPAITPSPELRFKHFATGFESTDQSHEALLWKLGAALFDEIDLKLPEGSSAEMVHRVTSLRRKEALAAWLRQAVAATVETECRGHVAASRQGALIFAHISGNQVEKACNAALESGDLRLATLLAQLGGGDDEVRADVADQLAIWRNEGVDAHIPKDHRKIYEVVSGNVTVSPGTASKAVRDPMDRVDDLPIAGGLDWKRAFGLHLWYGVSHDVPLTGAFERYEGAVGRQQDTAPPLPPYREKAGLGSLKLKELARTGSYHRDALFQLVKIYSNPTFDLETALSPLGFGPTLADYRLPWHLYVLLSRVLRRRDFNDRIELGVDALEAAQQAGVPLEGNSARADALTSDYAHQLELQGQWTWAAFVLLHLELPSSRLATLKALLSRNVDRIDEAAEEFLVRRLRIPHSWVYEARAIQARWRQDRFAEYELLLKAGLFSAAHDVAVRHLAPEAVIRDDMGVVLTLFTPIQEAFPEGLHLLPGWNTGGGVYVDYAACKTYLPRLLSGAETRTLSSEDSARFARLAARIPELIDLVPGLFPDLSLLSSSDASNGADRDLNQIVARSEMLAALHNLARVLSTRPAGVVPSLPLRDPLASASAPTPTEGGKAKQATWDSTAVPPEVEHVQNAANDYMAMLLQGAA